MKLAWPVSICIGLLMGCASSPGRGPAAQLPQANPERLIVVALRNQNAPAIPRAGSTVRSYDAPVSYSLSPATRASARTLAAAHKLREVASWPIGLLGVHCVVFELPGDTTREDVLMRLRRDPRVESAQPYHSFRTLGSAARTGNDPYRPLQRNLDVMNVTGAHAWSRGEGVKIAVIDTGIDATHPDLAGRVARQTDFVSDARGVAGDRHGTAVAGIIAATGNNQQGIMGIAPAVRLYGMRACWPEPGDGASASCSTLTLAKALAAAIEARVEVVNLSLVGPADPLLTRLVLAGLERGTVFVAANPAPGNRNSFPTGIPGVIGVESSEAPASVDSVLFAPAREVLTLVPDGGYDFLSGSSLAAASVSGGVALLLARDRSLRADDIKGVLARSSRRVSTQRGDSASVDLCAALAAVMRQPGCGE